MQQDLEKTVETKIKPMLEEAMQKYLGVTVSEIGADITEKLKKGHLLGLDINTKLPFKRAKNLFKKWFLMRLLKTHFGNVSDVARISRVDRRTIHRLVVEMKHDIDKFRVEMAKREYWRQAQVRSIIESALESYKSSIHPSRFDVMYKQAPEISKDIAKELFEPHMTLKEAEAEFEKLYLKKALEESNFNISQTARKIGLRFETLHRKLKRLGLL